MENRAARVCELCGEQYPPSVMHCLQDGEPTSPATTAFVPAARSAAVLLGSFFAPDDVDSRETSAALVPPSVNTIDDLDDFEEIEPDLFDEAQDKLADEEESSSTRRALKAVDFAGLRKYITPAHEAVEQQETAFALKPVRSTLPPLLDSQETAAVPKSKRSLLDLETRPFLGNLADKLLADRPTVDAVPTNKNATTEDAGEEGEATSFKLKKVPSEPKVKAFNPKSEPGFAPKKPEKVTERDLNAVSAKIPSTSKVTIADKEAPKALSKKLPSSDALQPLDPQALDDWKIEKKVLASGVLKSIPIAQTMKRPSFKNRYIAALALLVGILCVGGFILSSLLDHAVEKKEQLASLAPIEEKVEISLHSNPSGARVSGTINGEPFSPRFSPGTLVVPKGAAIELTFEYANYSSSRDQFIADAPRDLSVHLSLLPVDPSTRPQQVATSDPKETPTKTKSPNKTNVRPNIKVNTTVKTNTTKTTPPTNTQNTGKRPPLPATPEL